MTDMTIESIFGTKAGMYGRYSIRKVQATSII